jgi:hypothetical protein
MKIERWGWYSIAVNILLALLHGLTPAREYHDYISLDFF